MDTWEILHRWYMPFVWLALSGAISLATAIYLQLGMTMHTGSELGIVYGNMWVLRDEYLETIVVYLLGFGSAIWLLDSEGTTRWAAFWALLIAIARISIPIWLVTSADIGLPSGEHYVDWHTMRVVIWFADFQLYMAGLMLWFVFRYFAGDERGFSSAQLEAY